MKESDEELLADSGWVIECESPLELRHSDGSFATKFAAYVLMSHLNDEKNEKSNTIVDYFKIPYLKLDDINEYLKSRNWNASNVINITDHPVDKTFIIWVRV